MRTIIYVILVIVLASCLLWGARWCNKEIVRSLEKEPIIGPIIERIERKIPRIIGGDKPLTEPKKDGEDPKQSDDLIAEKKKFRFDPHFDIGVTAGVKISNPTAKDVVPKVNLGVSVASYGKDRRRTDWRFARFGIGTNMKDVEVTFSPVMKSLGNDRHPILANTFLHPFVSYNITSGGIGAGVGLSISF